MSYEGREEYLCPKGHYAVCDCHDELIVCDVCGEPYSHRHAIDDTNGYEKDSPSTYPAEKEKIGEYEVVVKVGLYKPIGREWQPIKRSPRVRTEEEKDDELLGHQFDEEHYLYSSGKLKD